MCPRSPRLLLSQITVSGFIPENCYTELLPEEGVFQNLTSLTWSCLRIEMVHTCFISRDILQIDLLENKFKHASTFFLKLCAIDIPTRVQKLLFLLWQYIFSIFNTDSLSNKMMKLIFEASSVFSKQYKAFYNVNYKLD